MDDNNYKTDSIPTNDKDTKDQQKKINHKIRNCLIKVCGIVQIERDKKRNRD